MDTTEFTNPELMDSETCSLGELDAEAVKDEQDVSCDDTFSDQRYFISTINSFLLLNFLILIYD